MPRLGSAGWSRQRRTAATAPMPLDSRNTVSTPPSSANVTRDTWRLSGYRRNRGDVGRRGGGRRPSAPRGAPPSRSNEPFGTSRASARGGPGSARHQNREARFQDDVPGAAAEDHLTDAALRVSALQQEIGTSRHRLFQKRLTLGLLPAIGCPDAYIYAVLFERARQLFALGTRLGHMLRAYRNDDDFARLLEERHPHRHRDGGLGAAVPRDRDDLAQGRQTAVWHHQHPAAALDQGIFEGGLGNRGELFGLLDHDQIEDPADHPDDCVLPPVLLAPGGARTIVSHRHRIERDAFCIHEVAKQPARLVAALLALALEGPIDLRRNREPHLAAEHHGAFGREAVQSADMAVEALRRHQSGVEHRAGIAVADHGQQIFHRALLARARPDPGGAFIEPYTIQPCFASAAGGTAGVPPARLAVARQC